MSRRKEEILDAMRERKMAYALVFGQETPQSRAVLADLKRFCRAGESTFHPDPRVHALLEGRRECVLRIMDFVEMDLEDLAKKYGGVTDVPT